MKKLKINFITFIASVAIFFANSVLAQNAALDNSSQISKFVEGMGNRIISIANDKKISDNQKKDKIIDEIDKVTDSDWISKFVLGKNYREASDAQKSRFSSLYRQFLINTYGPKFKNYNGKKFNVLSVEQQSSFYIVKCEFLPHDSDIAINVNFRVKDRDGKLLILDFVAEGVSLIETHRSEFNSAISAKGMDNFLEDLQARVNELKRSPTAKKS